MPPAPRSAAIDAEHYGRPLAGWRHGEVTPPTDPAVRAPRAAHAAPARCPMRDHPARGCAQSPRGPRCSPRSSAALRIAHSARSRCRTPASDAAPNAATRWRRLAMAVYSDAYRIAHCRRPSSLVGRQLSHASASRRGPTCRFSLSQAACHTFLASTPSVPSCQTGETGRRDNSARCASQ